jgi:hypothetical protein
MHEVGWKTLLEGTVNGFYGSGKGGSVAKVKMMVGIGEAGVP